MSQTKKENLMNKPLIDLREMLERENKLLANKKFIEKLKDKGEKVKRFRDEIERVIKIKESVEETESFLAKLSIGDKAILPKHPMFSMNSSDMRLAKQAVDNEQRQQKQDIVRELLNEEIDIYSIALTRTFDKELCQQRSDRFMPSKIPNKKKDDSQSTENKSSEMINKLKFISTNSTKQSKDQLSNQMTQSKASTSNEKVDLFAKYKDTALEVFEKEDKFVPLTVEESLQFGKDQKVKDYQVDKIRLENRLEWRKIIEFDSDDSESSDDSRLSSPEMME